MLTTSSNTPLKVKTEVNSDTKNAYNDRLQKHKVELRELYLQLYRNNQYYNEDDQFESLLVLMNNYAHSREAQYKRSDIHNAQWFKSNDVVATTLYIDLFCGDLSKLKKHISYFKELGVNLIHFMPVLEARAGENDGGYAVQNYKNIDPKFGNNKQFKKVLNTLRKNGIHSCIDFVVNHTAVEHEFAQRAIAGEQKYRDMYLLVESDDTRAEFERTVAEVFPSVAPGNFTYHKDMKNWVFTSFYPYQWDLNYANPIVFEAVIDIFLYWANQGVDMIRLDAIPFMWKELGHSCRNHPNVHILLRMFNLVGQIVCPSVSLLGEAIVKPEEIVKYFGESEAECSLMYNATHMVNLWNSISSRDTRTLEIDTRRLKTTTGGVWVNYARCHDDIGWGFNEEAIESFGLNAASHKQFLINFFRGSFDGSFSVGNLYEFDPTTMDARNCGSLASLLGLESASYQSDEYQRELALKRINLFHNVLMSSSGIPLIYSGDEVATLNNYDYLNDPKKMHDSRWLHRSRFDHKKAERRSQQETNEHIVFNSLKKLITIRKSHSIFASNIDMNILNISNVSVYGFTKQLGNESLICLSNFSEDRQFIQNSEFLRQLTGEKYTDLLSGKSSDFTSDTTLLGPYEFIWFLCGK